MLSSVTTRLRWPSILERAAAIVHSYDTTTVTLRQLFYRLVAEQLVPNTLSAYVQLSRLSAQARREGWFPSLFDQGRPIEGNFFFKNTDEARGWLRQIYRRDRTAGQPYALYLASEKATLNALMEAWFGDLGIPRFALRGYSSQTLADDVADLVAKGEPARPAVLLYAGDYDPTGVHIPQDFVNRTDCWAKVIRVAVNHDQIGAYGLSPMPAKTGDSRRRLTGVDEQVEVEALPPDVLEGMFRDAVAQYWDEAVYERVLRQEAADRQKL